MLTRTINNKNINNNIDKKVSLIPIGMASSEPSAEQTSSFKTSILFAMHTEMKTISNRKTSIVFTGLASSDNSD